MKNFAWILLFCLTAIHLNAQERLRNGHTLHTHTQTTDVFLSPALLARQITAYATTDRQKADAIMQWIAEHIAYNTRNDGRSFYNIAPAAEDSGSLKPLNDRVAEMVLQRGKAVCEGYARLFASLCSYAGLHAELVRGYAKTNIGRYSRVFHTNHTWNAVLIDSSWYLADATWASGYINYRDEYEAHYDDAYFLASPGSFAQDHYPEELRWALLPQFPAPKEFDRMPFQTAAFLQLHVHSFFPAGGTVTASPGDTLHFTVQTEDTVHGRLYASDQVLLTADSIATIGDSIAQAAPVTTGTRLLTTSYLVPDGNTSEWLDIIYKNAVILRYRLRVKAAQVRVEGVK